MDELHATGLFDVMDKSVDEDEHSIEMHLPFIAQVGRLHRALAVCCLLWLNSPV